MIIPATDGSTIIVCPSLTCLVSGPTANTVKMFVVSDFCVASSRIIPDSDFVFLGSGDIYILHYKTI